MKLTDAKFCCDCEQVFDGSDCPECGRSACSVCLSDWLMSLHSPAGMVYLAQRVEAHSQQSQAVAR